MKSSADPRNRPSSAIDKLTAHSRSRPDDKSRGFPDRPGVEFVAFLIDELSLLSLAAMNVPKAAFSESDRRSLGEVATVLSAISGQSGGP